MQLEVERSFNLNVITPYIQRGVQYYLLFRRECESGPFFVRDTAYRVSTYFQVGEIVQKVDDTRQRVVGNIFWTQVNCRCEGSFLMAYSGVFREQAQRSIPSAFQMDLVVKDKGFHMFHQKNKATLVISPAIHSSIKANLEI
jgi:hypothetical protein